MGPYLRAIRQTIEKRCCLELLVLSATSRIKSNGYMPTALTSVILL